MRNYLTLLGQHPDKKSYGIYQCVCGNTGEYPKSRVKANAICSCGCDSPRPMIYNRSNDPLKNIYYSHKFNKYWDTYFDFAVEMGTPPLGAQNAMVVPIVPGTQIMPGNVKWGFDERYFYDPDTDTFDMHHEKMIVDTDLHNVSKELSLEDPNDPSTWEAGLVNITKAFDKDRIDDPIEWQKEIERKAQSFAMYERKRAEEQLYEKGRVSQTQVGRLFRFQLVNALGEMMEDWYKQCSKLGSGTHFHLLHPLIEKKGLDFTTLAHITVTVVMDNLGRGSAFNIAIGNLKKMIGERIDHQAFLNVLEAMDPREFDKIDRWYLRNGEMGYQYKINYAKKHSQELNYQFLGADDLVRVGDWCFTCFERITKWFDRIDVRNEKKDGRTAYLCLSEEGLKHRMVLQNISDQAEFEAWAMVCPPLDWTPEKRGGYLLRHPGNYNDLIHNDKGTIPSQSAFDALNKQQAVPFTINRFIYNVQVRLLCDYNSIGAFKTYEKDSWEAENTPCIDAAIWDLPKDHKDRQAARRRLRKMHQEQKKAEKLHKNPYRVLKQAARFINEDRIYFSCYFDSRLRIYTHAVGLTYQGSDYQKALLQFADGLEVTDDNRSQVETEMLVTIANCWGNDKISFDDRVEFARELVKECEVCVRDPLSSDARSLWAEAAGEAFQFLAILKEYYDIFIDKKKTHTTVAGGRDASNSGNQILGGMCRDEKTCFYTNVITEWEDLLSDKPQDLYGVVAEGVKTLIRNDNFTHSRVSEYIKQAQKKAEKGDFEINADAFTIRPQLPDLVTRKTVKRAVMIDAYGGSWRSKNEHISEELSDASDDKISLAEKRLVTDACVLAQKAAFPLSDCLNVWFKELGKSALEAGREFIEWETPDGSYVVQEYRVPDVIPVTTYAMGGGTYYRPVHDRVKHTVSKGKGKRHSEKRTSVQIRSGYKDEIMTGKTQTALGANFTHSHDSCIIRGAMNLLETEFFGIHDCLYAPHGTLQDACRKLRESYLDTVKTNALKGLADSNEIDIPEPLMGKADIDVCVDSPYMFG